MLQGRRRIPGARAAEMSRTRFRRAAKPLTPAVAEHPRSDRAAKTTLSAWLSWRPAAAARSWRGYDRRPPGTGVPRRSRRPARDAHARLVLRTSSTADARRCETVLLAHPPARRVPVELSRDRSPSIDQRFRLRLPAPRRRADAAAAPRDSCGSPRRAKLDLSLLAALPEGYRATVSRAPANTSSRAPPIRRCWRR